ncbi:hypothetical protein CYY_005773 [Polysphondylium violaceum]|uniref:Uncharacterized protein n=1 Tax=Polysphondylium violaceum TaxID=133409 RepID=A0A8J4URY7_9MYCE|nr:hypothetical protein CYY_005773 [Polysphondylium violaceum]
MSENNTNNSGNGEINNSNNNSRFSIDRNKDIITVDSTHTKRWVEYGAYLNARSKVVLEGGGCNPHPYERQVSRDVFCMDAVEWVKQNEIGQDASIITSLPDITEISNFTLEEYKLWFRETVQLICSKLTDTNVAIFYQTDIKKRCKKSNGRFDQYVDKGYLCQRGAEEAGCKVVWHKIMTASDKPFVSRNKACFSHMICVAKSPRLLDFEDSTPDINRRGDMIWSRAMGLNSCKVAIMYLKSLNMKCVVDPFCGKGSILAVANLYGMNSIGVDLSVAKSRESIALTLDPILIETFSNRYCKVLEKKQSGESVVIDDTEEPEDQQDQQDQDQDKEEKE